MAKGRIAGTKNGMIATVPTTLNSVWASAVWCASAERGDRGLETVLRERPSLVLLDLMLSGTDGLSVCREIRRTPSVAATPIVKADIECRRTPPEGGFDLLAERPVLALPLKRIEP